MRRRTNLKAVPDEKPEQLTFAQIIRLARDIAHLCGDDEHMMAVLLLLTDELMKFSDDSAHVETIAIHLAREVFADSVRCGNAEKRYRAELREKFLKGGEGR